MPLSVIYSSTPPDKIEFNNFRIIDIFHRLRPEDTDPFVLWHEWPRARHKRFSFPGAPKHPHRGFMECPYLKEVTADTGSAAVEHVIRARNKIDYHTLPGSFEILETSAGLQHEFKMDRQWSGHLHGFQLWVNLPGQCKTQAPLLQTCAEAALPITKLPSGATVKILHGQIGEICSPTECEVVDWQYFDFEVPPNKFARYTPPPEMSSRMMYVYEGSGSIEKTKLEVNMFAILGGSGELVLKAGDTGCNFMFLAGKQLKEEVTVHGPFVMSTKQQITECFHDLQAGTIAPHKIDHNKYET